MPRLEIVFVRMRIYKIGFQRRSFTRLCGLYRERLIQAGRSARKTILRQEAREGLHSDKETDDCAFERMIYFARLSTWRDP
jgi:hypothetical protein